jgi:hypothetical protein
MKIAVVASGWHFPLHFYRAIAQQKLPPGWSQDMFCVAHRDPKYSEAEKREIIPKLGWSYREALDKIFYEKVATVPDIEALGWKYMLEPNTNGDWGNTNQWLEKYDYKQYDMLLASHDDNFLLNDRLYTDLLVPEGDWLITTNSAGQEPLSLRDRISKWWNKPIPMRASFEFIKPEVLDMTGGKFDLSMTTLSREGYVNSDIDLRTISDWNNNVRPLKTLLATRGMKDKVRVLSPYLRVSEYCIEGQRGYISLSSYHQRILEDKGFACVEALYTNLLSENWRGNVLPDD